MTRVQEGLSYGTYSPYARLQAGRGGATVVRGFESACSLGTGLDMSSNRCLAEAPATLAL